ncbi:IS1182 family transposase [candidate division WOR-3 bacterium]|nr:IS1182 family transposase [candidate division WOR-3 bacterium]
MSNEIEANYNQQYLFPPRLEDLLPSDHPARFIREFVDSINLDELGFKRRKSEEGRPNYSAELLTKVWLYGYFISIRSSRKLEQACMDNIGMLWLTGMNYPDHNTLWRFYRDNREAIKQLFKKVGRIAMEGGLIGLVLNAIDGTKITADVSRKNTLSKEDLEELAKKLEDSVEEVISEIESKEGEGEGEYRLPKSLADKDNLKEFVKERLERLEEEGRKYINLTDKDSRMIKNGKVKEFCYNAQATVDSKHGLIVGADVIEEESDNHQLVNRIEEVKETVGREADENLLDGGYFSGEELNRAEEKGYNVLINIPKNDSTSNNKYNKSNFTYDEKKDVYICPKERELHFERENRRKDKDYLIRVYHCDGYKECPYRWECSENKRGRTIDRTSYDSAIRRQREKQKDANKVELLKKRKEIVEPIFGYIKAIFGFRRWTVRGIEGVRAQWYMICTAVNLRKMYKEWSKGSFKLLGA